jgi:hypothetical protein
MVEAAPRGRSGYRLTLVASGPSTPGNRTHS